MGFDPPLGEGAGGSWTGPVGETIRVMYPRRRGGVFPPPPLPLPPGWFKPGLVGLPALLLPPLPLV